MELIYSLEVSFITFCISCACAFICIPVFCFFACGNGSSVLKTVLQGCLFMCICFLSGNIIREGFKKSKWKFKMAFAMKGGVETGHECHIPILKNDFF